MKSKMLRKLLLSSILLALGAGTAYGFEIEKPSIVRVKKKLKLRTCLLTELESQTHFDGKYFKIVKNVPGEDGVEQVISLDEKDETMLVRASTTYCHLMKARDYYKTIFPEERSLDNKILVRVDMERQWSNVIHYKHDEAKSYNGSFTVPAADSMADEGTESWGNEIWFLKAQKVKRKSSANQVASYLNQREFKNAMMGQLLYEDVYRAAQQVAYGTYTWESAELQLYGMLMSVAISELVPQTLAFITKFLKDKYYLDTALIPEIIMHEYGHIALAPILGLGRESAVVEGFPNYFVTKMTGLLKLGAKAKKHSKGDGAKKALSKRLYSFEEDYAKRALHGSFTYSLLYRVDQVLGEGIVVNALKYLDQFSDIKNDLVHALFLSIDDLSDSPTADKIKLHTVLKEKGL